MEPYRGDRAKLERLAEIYGMTVDDLIARYELDAIVPGICMNQRCDYANDYEPDQAFGWCEECAMETVKSALLLAGLI